jgi:hypothetical protein
MNDGYIELAKILKERDNPNQNNLIIGQIISPLPQIKIRIYEKVILDKENLLISEHIYSHYKQEIHEKWLGIGDEVSLMPINNHQMYYLLDKVVRL